MGEGHKARTKAELTEVLIMVLDSGRRGIEGGRKEAGRKGRDRRLRFMEQAMELDGRETEIVDPLSIQGLETVLIC